MPRNSRGRETDGDPHPPDRRPFRLVRTLPSFERKPLMSFARMASVCLRGERDAEQIEGAALGLGGGGKDGGEAIAPKADDIAGERGEIAKQGMEAVHREWFALCRVSAFANGLALRRRRGLGLGHRRDALRLAGGWIGLVE